MRYVIFFLIVLVSAIVIAFTQLNGYTFPGIPTQNQYFTGFRTDESRSSVSLAAITSSGGGKDGVKVLKNPSFVIHTEVNMPAESEGIVIKIGDEAKFYPLSILVWHEVINDTVGGTDVAVMFCKTCEPQVFERLVGWDLLEFRVSGFMYDDTPIVYDTATESFWQQSTGVSIVGKYMGTTLNRVPFERLGLGVAIELYPTIQVMELPKGFNYPYSSTPYLNDAHPLAWVRH